MHTKLKSYNAKIKTKFDPKKLPTLECFYFCVTGTVVDSVRTIKRMKIINITQTYLEECEYVGKNQRERRGKLKVN